MRLVIAGVALLIAAVPAGAISRHNAWSMSCSEAKSVVRAEGATILRFRSTMNSSVPRYGRFVADNRFCSSGEYAEVTYIPTADVDSCPVRECHQYDIDEDPFLFRRF